MVLHLPSLVLQDAEEAVQSFVRLVGQRLTGLRRLCLCNEEIYDDVFEALSGTPHCRAAAPNIELWWHGLQVGAAGSTALLAGAA